MLDANVGKFGRMSLAYGFMKLVRRGNNPEKETLIDIPYILWSHLPSKYNPSYPRLPNYQAHSKLKSYLKFFILERVIGLKTMRDRYVERIIQTRKPS